MFWFIPTFRDGLIFASLLWAAYLLTLLGKRIHWAYIGPLSKIPGPKLYFISRGFMQARAVNGERWKWLKNHVVGRYGPIFRLSPRDVLITDKHLIKQILEMNLPKSVNYVRFRQTQDVETLFTATDKIFHKQRRRIISPAFSIKYLNSLEPLVAGCLRELIVKIDEVCDRNDSDNIFDLYKYMVYLLLDITGETAFGGSFNIVRTGFHPLPQKVRDGLKRVVITNMFPILKLFMRADPYLHEFTTRIIKERRQLGATPRHDILQILLDAGSEGAMTDFEIHEQILEFLVAGTDSTSFTATVCMIYLVKHPETMRKLVHELDRALGPIDDSHDDASVVMHEPIKALPYLNAVINEVMRIWPVSIDGATSRRVTEDMTVGGYFIPKDTTLFLFSYPLHLDPNEWGENANDFVPERWLEPEKLPLKDCYYPFSSGTRNCIGQNLALMEIRIALATLLRRYSWEQDLSQEFDVVTFVAPALKGGSYKLRVRRRRAFAAA